jgi:sulfur carrier protein
MAITVRINDQLTIVPLDMTVAGLIAERYAGRRWLAVAVDGDVVPRATWPDRRLHDGAVVEILTAVQGG